jgi:DNA (cytosine-5)-methyltransferase 1
VLTVGSLFAGIGGFDLGLERAGMRTLWFCEADPFCKRVLARHWPGVPCYPDVPDLRGADVAPVDVLCGGFPCQDISVAGRGAGIRGEQSGLWSEMFRLTGELRPRYLLVENVAALIARGLDVVLADLASIGFDAEWDVVRASDVGAPHIRERIWLLAYPASNGRGSRWSGRPDPSCAREQQPALQAVADAHGEPSVGTPVAWAQRDPWPAEPDVPRMAHGVSHGVDRRRVLGNALVPKIAEWIGRRIMTWESLHA